MLFSSIEFICLFLPVALIGAALASRLYGSKGVVIFLITASAVFYGWHIPVYLLLLAASVLVNYGIGLWLARRPDGRVLALGVAFNLGLLGYFKYAGFFAANLGFLIGESSFAAQVALPLAISFFTFQQIAYLVDIRRGEARPADFFRYVLFVIFFPQLIAGPIVHHKEMTPQFGGERFGRLFRSDLYIGAVIFVIGLSKKTLLADPLGRIADTTFNAAAVGIEPSMAEAWAGAVAYGFQIYFDFSGYSDMAIGLARMFGVKLPVNFLAPYRAVSIIDFWRRWHITLSRFLRDYVYFPLGGNRRGPARRHVNLMMVMLVGGLWHGAAWTFVVWGGLHGLYLVVNHGLRRWAPAALERWMATAAGRASGIFVTFLAVTVAWVFFRADSFDSAFIVLAAMTGAGAGAGADAGALALFAAPDEMLLRLTVAAGIVWLAPASMEILARLDAKERVRLPTFAISRPAVCGAAAAVCLFTIFVSGSYEFLYFQF